MRKRRPIWRERRYGHGAASGKRASRAIPPAAQAGPHQRTEARDVLRAGEPAPRQLAGSYHGRGAVRAHPAECGGGVRIHPAGARSRHGRRGRRLLPLLHGLLLRRVSRPHLDCRSGLRQLHAGPGAAALYLFALGHHRSALLRAEYGGLVRARHARATERHQRGAPGASREDLPLHAGPAHHRPRHREALP